MRLLALAAAAALGAPLAAQPVTKDAPIPLARTAPAWARSATLYEVNVRQFTPEGTFRALMPHLPRLDSMGVDVLWIMPVQPVGKVNRKGPLGSYYSIADYTAVNPEFGTAADFRALVDAAHRLGMRVLLDWVANHTAFDHVWTREHPEWYTRRADGSISVARDNEGKETDWTDVADLNYESRDMRRAMIAAMRWWLDEMDVDGFRCDIAHFVPADFWAEARQQLQRGHPDLFMLAEAEDPTLHASFEATYGWELHHLLNAVAKGTKGAADLDAYFAKQEATFPRGAFRMYFTSNHDENSWQGSEFERMGANHLPAFVLAATARSSLPLMYTGQEASMAKRLRFFEKDTVDWSGPSLAPFYRGMFGLKHRNEALWNGAWGGTQTRLATPGAGERVYAFARAKGTNAVLVFLNFGDQPARVSYAGLPAGLVGGYTDWFARTPETLRPAGAVDVPAHGYRVLVR